ncbi:MAG: membrane dipeptidase [Planctomycetota bacterium]
MSTNPWIDGHLDLAWLATDGGRDLSVSVDALRAQEPPGGLVMAGETLGRAAVTIPELTQSGCRLAVCSVFSRFRPSGSPERIEGIDGTRPADAAGKGSLQMAWYREQATAGRMQIVRTGDDLDRALASESPANGPLPVMLMIEGLDPLTGPEDVARWSDAGVRMASLVHSGANGLAYGNKADPGAGLTAAGRATLSAMDAAGWVLDVSHLNRRGFDNALDAFHGPVVASHSNCRALTDTDRHLDDDQLREVGRRGGVVGVVPYAPFVRTVARRKAKAEHGVGWAALADHAERIRELAGPGAPAIGSDLDGGFGADQLIDGMDRAGQLPDLADVLAERGWPEADRRGLLLGNWARVLRGALAEKP